MQLVKIARVRCVAVLVATVLPLSLAAPASAQTTQNGLVNVAVVGNTVQVPIGVAANVCGVQAAVLAANFAQNQTVNCQAVANATATRATPGGGGGGANQSGLVNIAIVNNTIQVPVAVAANICGVQAAVLAARFAQVQNVTCNAQGNANANA